MSYAVGSLVKARGREWVVLPESEEDMLVLRPLGGTEDEVAGVYLPLEPVEPASFELPDPTKRGDYRSSRLLRDAVRLGFRSSAGPFRSFAKIAVEPRPYQLVPLILALKLDPVRILISDDVGIGKTVEAALIAREMIDRGEADRLAILCPPQLAGQWQTELREKFHIEAEQVLPSTATRLERACRVGESIFDRYPFVVVSTDFVKSDRRRDDFLRACPELVIVDEAHTCAEPGEGRGVRHQRHRLVSGLAADADRHVILVTATPHSGKEDAFRSLLRLLDSSFADLPDDLSGPANEKHRRRLARHFVQRRRADIRDYLDAETPFPDREENEVSYNLSPGYQKLFQKALRYARETVREDGGGRFRQRVRWWSALALLRSIASSPAAAAATLRSRAATGGTENAEEADEVGRRTVLDLVEDESPEGTDLAPGSDSGEESDEGKRNRRRLLEMAREAEALFGAEDAKLQKATKLVFSLIEDGFHPIIFCRFVPTAEYVADALRKKLKGVEVVSVTGALPPTEREARVESLGKHPKRVLVATDCLSEGINLQKHFDAVFHYDLSWNPTRHEQREGRVDRYGQPKGTVRALTYYGVDNQIDGIVLDVLLRKHKRIRGSLGISVPVPGDTEEVVEAIFEGLLLREGSGGGTQELLPGFEEYLRPRKEDLFGRWDNITDREKRSRTVFSQQTVRVDEVARELEAVRSAVGSGVDVAAFAKESLKAHGAVISENGNVKIDLSEVPRAVREAIGATNGTDRIAARFELPVGEGEVYLSRTHPVIEGLASHVMDAALDPLGEGIARRSGVTVTSRVGRRTTLLLVRYRYHILTRRGGTGEERALLAEDCQVVAFSGSPASPEWLSQDEAEALLWAEPEGNVAPDRAAHFLRRVISDGETLKEQLAAVAEERGRELLEAHRRVREASRERGVSQRVEPNLPPDILGVYVYLPKVGG
ncbi:MAG: DEAD/DEAH box helicase [Actinomycetota bacterium]|nr:DEAD/DEAH box helicase [Actinomycetota bacterium]